jgi:hypothetical protein
MIYLVKLKKKSSKILILIQKLKIVRKLINRIYLGYS